MPRPPGTDLPLKLLFQAVSHLVAPRLMPGWEAVGPAVAGTELQQAQRRVDCVVPVRRQGVDACLHLEFQLKVEPDLPRRLLDYHVGLYLRMQRPVFTVVVLLGPRPGTLTGQLDTGGTRFSYTVVHLARRPALELATDPALAALTPFGRGADRQAVARAASTLRQVAEPALRADCLAVLQILGTRLLDPGTIRDIIDIQEVRMSSFFEVAHQEGLAKGKHEGRLEGVLEGRRALVAEQVGRRFPGSAAELLAELGRCGEADLRWLGLALLDAGSAEGLVESLRARLART